MTEGSQPVAGEQAAPKGHAVVVPIDRALGPELVALLGALADAGDDAAEAALSLQPRAALLRLVSVKVINAVPAINDDGYAIVLTERGREVLQQCAELISPENDPTRRSMAAAELELARRQPPLAASAGSTDDPTRAQPRPLLAWAEANAGLLQAIGIVLGVVVAVVIALLTT